MKILSSNRILNADKIRINIDLTSFLPGRISEEILNNPRRARPRYFIEDYELRTNCNFKDVVKRVKLYIPELREIIKDNPVIYIYNEYMHLTEKVRDNNDKLITHYHLGKLKPKYTIKISTEENETNQEMEENNVYLRIEN